MVQPNEILEALATSCKQHTILPQAINYATVELDAAGEHSNVSLPLVEFRVDDIRRDESRNTDRVGVTVNDQGVETGYRYRLWFTMDVVVDVQTASGTSITHRELDQLVRKSLYRHDTHGPARPLPDPDTPTESLSGINWVVTSGTAPTHDFGLSPSVRSRQIRAEIGFEHEITSADLGIEYDAVKDVDIFASGPSGDG